MTLFDRHGVIRRYESAEDILEEFFELRMEFYSLRRLALIQAPRTPEPCCIKLPGYCAVHKYCSN